LKRKSTKRFPAIEAIGISSVEIVNIVGWVGIADEMDLSAIAADGELLGIFQGIIKVGDRIRKYQESATQRLYALELVDVLTNIYRVEMPIQEAKLKLNEFFDRTWLMPKMKSQNGKIKNSWHGSNATPPSGGWNKDALVGMNRFKFQISHLLKPLKEFHKCRKWIVDATEPKNLKEGPRNCALAVVGDYFTGLNMRSIQKQVKAIDAIKCLKYISVGRADLFGRYFETVYRLPAGQVAESIRKLI